MNKQKVELAYNNECHSTLKRNEMLTDTTTWTNYENMLSDKGKSQKIILYDYTYVKCPK